MVAGVDSRTPAERRITDGVVYGLRVEVSQGAAGGARVVSLIGEASVWNAAPIRDAVATLVGSGAREVVMDLSDCTLLSSLAIAAMIDLGKRLRAHAGIVRLAGPSPTVLETILRLRLEQLFPIHATVAQALDAASVRTMSLRTCA